MTEELKRLKIAFWASLTNANAGMKWLDHDSMEEMVSAAWVGFQEPAQSLSDRIAELEGENAALREKRKMKIVPADPVVFEDDAESLTKEGQASG